MDHVHTFSSCCHEGFVGACADAGACAAAAAVDPKSTFLIEEACAWTLTVSVPRHTVFSCLYQDEEPQNKL